MTTKTEQHLIREYVRIVLAEDGGGGDGYGDIVGASMAMSPFGAHFASQSDLYKLFIKPFVDVIDVAAGKTKEISRRGQTVVAVGFKTIATTLLPWLSQDYKDIFEKQQHDLDKIKSQYAEVYDATWDAFRYNDIALTAFLMYPAAILTSHIAKQVPQTTMKILSIMSGGRLDPFFGKVNKALGFGGIHGYAGHEKGGGGVGGGNYGMGYGSGADIGGHFGEGLIREDGEEANKKDPNVKLGEILTNPKVIQKALSSPEAQRMQKDAKAMVHNTLTQVYNRAKGVANAKTLEDLQKNVGKPLKGINDLQKADPKERAAAETQILQALKKSSKEMYAKELEAQLKDALKAGVPENSGFVSDYKNVIQKIRQL